MPACALTTPQVAACRDRKAVGAKNDLRTSTLSADLSLAGGASVVLAATSADPGGEGGEGGTYAATELKPSGSWSAGGSTGSFTYSYPLTMPPAASGLVPQLAFGYDSGSIDGQTASTQAQAWVGDGWSAPPSFIEQSFVPCSDDPEGSASPDEDPGHVLQRADADPVAEREVLLLWASTTAPGTGPRRRWSVVTQVTNSGNGTGTYNTDYWKVTDARRDGY